MDRMRFRLLFLFLASFLASARSNELGSPCTKDRQCKVDNSHCSSGVCACKHYHAALGTTECLESKLLGRDCLVNEQCSLRVANSTCNGGHCQCSPGFIRFRKHTCLGPAKPGDVCYSDEHCQLWSKNSHCKFLIRKLFGKCVCDSEGDCAPNEATNPPVTDSAAPDTNKTDSSEGSTEATTTESKEGEAEEEINEAPEESKDPQKTNIQFVDPFQHQKEHLREGATKKPEGERASTVTDDTRMENVTTESDVSDAETTTVTDDPAEGSKYRVEAGEKDVPANWSDVAAVSLGYPCRSDVECRKTDDQSRCLNGICDCVPTANGTDICNSRNTGCGPETFQCRESGVCISWFFVCDGRDDCSDKSDEECQGPKCPETSFRCGDSETCVSRAVLCDGVKNCPNGEDERFCVPDERNSTRGCPEHTFRCTDGRCLPKFEFCNAVPKCSDGSDESPLLCSAQPHKRKAAKRKENCPFECGNGRCRSTAIVCSGRDGCGDNSDEAACSVCQQISGDPTDAFLAEGKVGPGSASGPILKYELRAMSRRKNIRIALLLIASVGMLAIYYSSNYERQTFKIDLRRILNGHPYESEVRAGYVIWRPNCKMLDPDPWDESIEKYLSEPRPLVCSRLPRLTYVDQRDDLSNVLKINMNAINKYKVRPNHSIKCCYKTITRINLSAQDYNITADSLYELSNCRDFSEQVLLSNDTEFILVSCQSNQKGKGQGKTIYKDVHPLVPILPEVGLKMKTAEKTRKKLNVIILGIDSVSKLNLRRTMPRTLKFLQETKWVELNGYNKVGENTFPNLMAILSGEPMRSLEEKCWANRTQKVDDCPFIWKEYDRKGYVTLYAEDTPAISTFNLMRTGFVRKPTDYYMRPFMVAAHDLLHLKNVNGLPVCLGPVLIVDHVLSYAKRFLRAFDNHNHFSLLWLNSLTHNDVNAPRALDISVHKFLRELAKIGTYDNSLVLLLSDHGARFGNIREAFLGFLEERLPFVFVWTPKWYREKHPNKYKNLIANRNRLTSPYDVYVTLKKLLDESEGSASVSAGCPKCSGLLEVQSPDRSCAEASVDVNWCLCSQFRNVPVGEKRAKNIADHLYKYIVDQTEELIEKENVNKSLCSKWKFVRVFRTDEIILPNAPQQYSLRNVSNLETERHEDEEVGSDTKMFVIIIELNPGKTKFESTVRMRLNAGSDNPSFALLEPPKRLDSIYKTSKCVENLLLKHYCYCVKR